MIKILLKLQQTVLMFHCLLQESRWMKQNSNQFSLINMSRQSFPLKKRLIIILEV